jgi:hypothetical protein
MIALFTLFHCFFHLLALTDQSTCLLIMRIKCDHDDDSWRFSRTDNSVGERIWLKSVHEICRRKRPCSTLWVIWSIVAVILWLLLASSVAYNSNRPGQMRDIMKCRIPMNHKDIGTKVKMYQGGNIPENISHSLRCPDNVWAGNRRIGIQRRQIHSFGGNMPPRKCR